jgi:sporulation protein YlmC with PRC-barrel domain
MLETINEEINSEVDKAEAEKFLADYTEAFIKRYIGTSKSRLKNTVDDAFENEEDPYKAVENKFNEWEQTRPQVSALEEVVKMAGALSVFCYAAAGITSKVWVTTSGHPCPFCSSLSGQVISVEENFMQKDDIMEVSSRTEGRKSLSFSSNIGHPPLHGGCQCVVSASTETAKLDKTVKDIENEIKDKDVEHVYIIDKNGNILSKNVGEQYRVPFEKGSIPKIKNNIIIHNHPGDPNSFSYQDVMGMIDYKASKSIVVSNKYRFILEVKEPGIYPDLTKVGKDYDNAFAGLLKKWRTKYENKEIPFSEVNPGISHEGISELFKMNKEITYKREIL